MPVLARPMIKAYAWIEDPRLLRLVGGVAEHYWIANADIPDLLQETRIALWETGSEAAVGAVWVLQVARHKAVDLLWRTLRARSRDDTFTVLAAGNLGDPEIKHLLKVRVAGLPPRLREFYDLHYTQAWSDREIAARLGMCRASAQWLDHCCRRDIIGPRAPAQSCPNPSEAFQARGGTNPASGQRPSRGKGASVTFPTALPDNDR